MKWIICALLVFFTVAVIAQAQQEESQSNAHSHRMSSSSSLSPEQGMSNADVLHEIESRLSTNTELNNTGVSTEVTDDTVTLTGFVDRQNQHALAVRIAEDFADGRRIVDNIQLGGNPDR